MNPFLDEDRCTLFLGDCLDVLRETEDCCVDAVVTDPPYGLEFMGKEWDGADGFRRSLNAADAGRDNAFGRASRTSPEYHAGHLFQEWVTAWAKEVIRVLKPGGHLLAFGGSRTYHRLACGVEDAGFEIRDSLIWMYGTGFPKSLNGPWGGTALKPAHEPIVLARKPLIGTVVANVLEHGTGGLNIDGCRIGEPNDGRWPANVVLDEEAAVLLDAQSGERQSRKGKPRGSKAPGEGWGMTETGAEYNDKGGASRFFYCAKASASERERGCDHLPAKTGGGATDRADGSDGLKNPRAGAGRGGGRRNFHPTVKPIAVMRWLVRLVTPPGGTVLDPFTGSGTTGIAALQEGAWFVGVEREEAYLQIAKARLNAELGNPNTNNSPPEGTTTEAT